MFSLFLTLDQTDVAEKVTITFSGLRTGSVKLEFSEILSPDPVEIRSASSFSRLA